MEIVPYNRREHGRHLAAWLESRAMNASVVAELPEIGYVALYNLKPIAAGFIRYVEGGFGLFDSLMTDPAAQPEDRNKAIDLVVNQILKAAQRGRLKRLIAYTADENTLVRSLRHGFVQLPHSLISIDIIAPSRAQE